MDENKTRQEMKAQSTQSTMKNQFKGTKVTEQVEGFQKFAIQFLRDLNDFNSNPAWMRKSVKELLDGNL